MFYTSKPDNALRFGDIVQGYPTIISRIAKPNFDKEWNFNIGVEFPYSVIMDPSCEIRQQTISLTPLIKISKKFFDNPYFTDDLTRINREMEPQEALSEIAWSKLDSEEQQKRLEKGKTYALLSTFIYEEHDLLPKYEIKMDSGTTASNYYMIDFRSTCKLCCNDIISPEKSPIYTKVLQISDETRQELTKKLMNYYARILCEGV